MKILAGRYKNRPIKTPKGSKTRPTSSKMRATIFNILQNQIEEARFLDLFAGSGSMGLEALSRGASSATFVEHNRAAFHCIRDNLSSLNITATVLQMDAKAALKLLAKKKNLFDLIYIDPPYDLDILYLLDLLPPILAPDGLILLEQSKHTTVETTALKQIDERNFGDTTLYFFKENRSL
ncbi:MAG: Ribosomal RNA small subunit methyltransferase D [Chlamydiae bacterium]|nr:Ribosomal RNA small subunit methyltransferase D [Chlamydiota bacterium]